MLPTTSYLQLISDKASGMPNQPKPIMATFFIVFLSCDRRMLRLCHAVWRHNSRSPLEPISLGYLFAIFDLGSAHYLLILPVRAGCCAQSWFKLAATMYAYWDRLFG
ncbi:MAG: hypothetical protein N6V49_00195 [Serratia symbiotica]|nr:hypothetical protein [Serratia symbiotica]